MKRVVRLTERDLTRIVRRVIMEQEAELEEGIFGPSSSELEERKMDLIRKIDDALEEHGLTDSDLYNSIDSVIRQAESDNYDGEVEISQSRTGRIVLRFIANPTKLQKSKFFKNIMSPMVGGMKGGHTFGGGRGNY
jgi:hypothetical protein